MVNSAETIKRLLREKPRNMMELLPIPWENPEVIWKCDAYDIVKCDTPWDYRLETYFLGHCLGTKDYEEFSQAHTVYSIRDVFGVPHATILCLKEGKVSPYNQCWDLGTTEFFRPQHLSSRKREKPLSVLQVRGRQDDVALTPFLSIAQEWFVAMSGYSGFPFDQWNRMIEKFMDRDFEYHFQYLLAEGANRFEWTHGNTRQRLLAQFGEEEED